MSAQSSGDPPEFQRGIRTSRFARGGGAQVASLITHDGVVFLDTLANGQQVITHSLALTRTDVPAAGGPYTLCISPDPPMLGCLVGSGHPPATILIEDLLPKQVYETSEKIMWVVEKQGNDTISSWCLTDRLREFSRLVVEVNGEGINGQVQVSQMQRPRDGLYFFWSLHDLYSVLNLTQCSGMPSKWSYQLGWSGQLTAVKTQLGLQCPLLKSARSTKVAEALVSTDCILQEICFLYIGRLRWICMYVRYVGRWVS